MVRLQETETGLTVFFCHGDGTRKGNTWAAGGKCQNSDHFAFQLTGKGRGFEPGKGTQMWLSLHSASGGE